MRVLVLGRTWFLGRRLVERLHERGDEVLAVHRVRSEPTPWVPVPHLHTDRRGLAHHARDMRSFPPQAVVDTCALTAADVDQMAPVPKCRQSCPARTSTRHTRVCGSDVCEAAVPLTEDSELRRERYPYKGLGIDATPDDYDKLDVEERWLDRTAVVLRLPLIYGPHDWQRREDIELRRLRAGRSRIPVGPANLLMDPRPRRRPSHRSARRPRPPRRRRHAG